jgi:putative ABC transport system substrate-binding protein
MAATPFLPSTPAAAQSTRQPSTPAAAQSTRQPVLSFIITDTQNAARYEPLRAAFREGLKTQGYVEDVNVTFEAIVDTDAAKLGEILRGRRPDIVIASADTAVLAKMAAPDLPIVFSAAYDPVAAGLVASLARPGGNVTGVVSVVATPLDGKRLEYLRMLFPETRPIGVLHNPRGPMGEQQIAALLDAAKVMGQPLEVANAGALEEFDPAIGGLAKRGVASLLILWNSEFFVHMEDLARLVNAHHLPAMFGWSGFANAGGLMGHSPDVIWPAREMGVYAGRILNGAKPADLPVIQSARFRLAVNAQAARRLGVTLPDRLLALADDVIE